MRIVVLTFFLAVACSAVEAEPKKYVASFGGNAFVEVKKSAGVLDLAKDFTIEAWVRCPSPRRWEMFAGDIAWPGISEEYKDVPRSTGWVLRQQVLQGRLVMEFTVASRQKEWVTMLAPVKPFEKLTHVAVCKKGPWVHLFVNGKPAQRLSLAQLDLIPSPTPLYLGLHKNGHADQGFDGQVAAFRVSDVSRYDKPFEPEESLAADGSTLVLFDIGKQKENGEPLTTLKDYSGHGRDGTLSGVAVSDLEGIEKREKEEREEEKLLLARLPRLNLLILTFAKANDGRQVGDGDCWRFVASAMDAAGAKRKNVYVFGQAVGLGEAVPGDLVHLSDFSCPGFGTPNHSAIVWRNHGGGRVTVIHASSPLTASGWASWNLTSRSPRGVTLSTGCFRSEGEDTGDRLQSSRVILAEDVSGWAVELGR